MRCSYFGSVIHRYSQCSQFPTMAIFSSFSSKATVTLLSRILLVYIFCGQYSASKIPIIQKENGRLNELLNEHRSERTSEHIITDCMTVTSDKGHYYFKASRQIYDTDTFTCGVYLMANPDEIIQVHFDYIDMPCESNNIVSFVDGWELNNSYFPNEYDYTRMEKDRVREYCGKKRVKKVFESSQNAALVRYQIPETGKGFSFYFTTRRNPTPCNILVESSTYIYTIRNYGQRINCSLLAMNPAKIQILSLTVGIHNYEKNGYTETGTFHNCDQSRISDYVQIGGGVDLGEYSVIADSICGIDSIPGDIMDAIFCGVTRIRLVSSGHSNNLITLTIDKVKTEETSESGILCPNVSNP